MKLSQKTRYGLRALIDLAINSKEDIVTSASIAARNDISPQYLEQVFASLKRAGIVKSVKGKSGGYYLADDPKHLTLDSVVSALEGDYHYEPEVFADGRSTDIMNAVQQVVVDQINEQLDAVLANTTLADLEKAFLELSSQGQDMYYI